MKRIPFKKRKIAVLAVALGLFMNGVVMAHALSLRDKIGQMLIMGFDGKQVDRDSAIVKQMNANPIGGVILFDYNFQTQAFDKNIESPEQVGRLNRHLQNFNHLSNLKHNLPHLPLLIAVDYEGGKVNRLRTDYGFPETFSVAAVGGMSEGAAEQVAADMAKTLNAVGFNLNFAPMVDVNVNPDNPIVGQLGRSFSADPNKVGVYASIYARQFLNKGVQCAYKHFPGHGSSTADSHLGFVDVTETWQDYELEPFQQLANADNACGMVMTAHIVNRHLDETGLPATLSDRIITGILRDQLHFKGVVISDDMQMKAISEHYGLEQALTLAINAGVDMFIFGNQLTATHQDPKQLVDIIESKVQAGEIKPARIDEAYQRIVHLKQSLPREEFEEQRS